jgi:hypothetical protein
MRYGKTEFLSELFHIFSISRQVVCSNGLSFHYVLLMTIDLQIKVLAIATFPFEWIKGTQVPPQASSGFAVALPSKLYSEIFRYCGDFSIIVINHKLVGHNSLGSKILVDTILSFVILCLINMLCLTGNTMRALSHSAVIEQ